MHLWNQDGVSNSILSEGIRGRTCVCDFRGASGPALTVAAQGQMGSELSNSSKLGHTRTRSQSGFVALLHAGDARAAQEAMSGQMTRQSCQADRNSPGSPDNPGRSLRT